MDALLSPCPSKRNCVCSCDPRPLFHVEPLRLPHEPQEVFQILEAYLRQHPCYRIVERSPQTIQTEFTSRVFGLVDDVAFALAEDCIHVRSASRVGYWDLGTNRRRIESIRRALKDILASQTR